VKSADSASAQPDPVRQADVPRPAAPALDTALKAADNAIAPAAASAPQATSGAITQHIQVTAQPRETVPNMPALAVEIAGKSQSGAKQFDIRLDPPELGRVEVRLAIDATGKASAHLSADQPQTLSLLQKDAHILTRALRDAGLDVSQDGLNFSLRQQQDNGAGAQSNQSGGRSGRGFALTATTSLEATASSAAWSGPADGHLDIKV
jgi:flagellar hook-length control protein FliK